MRRRLTLADVGETVTRKQAAEILGLGEWAVYTAIKRREIPTLPYGRRILIPKAHLEEVLGRSPSTTTTTNKRRASARR